MSYGKLSDYPRMLGPLKLARLWRGLSILWRDLSVRQRTHKSSRHGRLGYIGLVFSLIVLVLVVFFPAVSGGFLEWDDPANFLNNTAFHGLSRDHILSMLTCTVESVYQPLSWFIFALIYQISELNPFGYHLAGLIAHAVNTVLVFFLIRRLIYDSWPCRSRRRGMHFAAFFAAALYGLHPLRAEVVAWASGVPYTFATFFVLLSVLCYWKYVDAGRRLCFWLSVVAFGAGLACKPIALPFGFVLLLLDIYPLRRFSTGGMKGFFASNGKVWLEKVPFLFLGALFGAVAIAVEAYSTGAVKTVSLEPLKAIGKVFYSIVFHLRLTLFPVDLMPHYGWPERLSVLYPAFIVSAGLVISLSILAYRWEKSWPGLFVGWFSYLLLILPHTDLVSHGYETGADRYTYLSTIPFYVLAAWGLVLVLNCLKKKWLECALFIVIGCSVLIPCAFATRRRAGVWHDSFSLWGDVLQKKPNSYMAYDNMGFAYMKKEEYKAAERCFLKALQFNPDDAKAMANLGRIYLQGGNYEGAIKYSRQAVEKNPHLYIAYVHMAKAYSHMGNLDKAIESLEVAIKRSRFKSASAYTDCGHLYFKKGNFHKAIECYSKALELGGENANLYYNIGMLYQKLSKLDQAIRYYRKALEVKPSFAEAWNNLGSVYAARGDTKKALRCFEEAIRIKPDYRAALLNMGSLQKKIGNEEAANLRKNREKN
jgi:tetratricopeptide (TPR) repeat protein